MTDEMISQAVALLAARGFADTGDDKTWVAMHVERSFDIGNVLVWVDHGGEEFIVCCEGQDDNAIRLFNGTRILSLQLLAELIDALIDFQDRVALVYQGSQVSA